jgi:nitrous oxidase accessory protein
VRTDGERVLWRRTRRAAFAFVVSACLSAFALAQTDMDSMPRVDVYREKPVYLLIERDPRVYGLPPFQTLVDEAPAGSLLKPPPGDYAGPVRVDKPLSIDGQGQVTIDAGDKGTVFILATNDATLRGLRLTGSGSSHNTDDSCLDVRGNRNRIENLTLDNCLFGIDLKQSNHNLIRKTRIRSKNLKLGARGDALRLWYSHANRIEENEIRDSRDTVVWYSNNNVFRRNVGQRSRYSIHFMFANDNRVEDNRFYDNAVGIYFMYAEGGGAWRNIIRHSTGATGMGVGFKESSNVRIEDNEILYCGIGIGSDLSPFQPDTTIEIHRNRLAYNGVGILFNSEVGGNYLSGNIFEGNLAQVSYGGRGGSARNNEWRNNYWDDYQGFDRDGDGIGDQPHELFAFTDQIWMEIPIARFFYNSPMMALIDFLERLAPFSDPDRILRDERPLFHKPARQMTP